MQDKYEFYILFLIIIVIIHVFMNIVRFILEITKDETPKQSLEERIEHLETEFVSFLSGEYTYHYDEEPKNTIIVRRQHASVTSSDDDEKLKIQ